jgi:hypothetical protein
MISGLIIATLLQSAAQAKTSASASDKQRKENYAQADVDRKQEIRDRKELVTPAPNGFRASAGAQRIKLKLSVEKKNVRLGESLRYRLEIVNLGAEPYDYSEGPSFFKSGGLPHDRISLILKEPDGSTVSLRSPIGSGPDTTNAEIKFSPDLSEAQKEAKFDSMRRKSAADSKLLVTLAPGESIGTRGDAKYGFRDLVTRDKLEPGSYELHAELDGLFKPGLRSNNAHFTIEP